MSRVHYFRDWLPRWDRDNGAKVLFLLALPIFMLAALILLISAAGFWLGLALSKWHFVLAGVGALFVQYFITRRYFQSKYKQVFILAALLFLFFLTVSSLIAGYFYDLSWDGMAYHQEAIIRLSQGWNPFYHKLPQDAPHAIWNEHYPKAGEIMAAALYKLTGDIETGKAFNLLFIMGSFFLSGSLLLKFKKMNPGLACLTALLVALNPVSIYQVFTYYIDGLVAAAVTSLIVVCILIYFKPDRGLWGLLLALTTLLVNLKLTAAIYTLILGAGFFIWLWITKKRDTLKSFCLVGTLGLMVGVAFIGFNPYITNTIDHQYPSYPMVGPHQLDSITPRYFLNQNRFIGLFYSNFAPTNNMVETPPRIQFKIPLTLAQNELMWFKDADIRTGGFGSFFSGALCLFLILGGALLFGAIRDQAFEPVKGGSFLILVIMISVLVNPVTWWARYIPQFWLVPLTLIPGLAGQKSWGLKIGKYLLIGVLVVNVSLAAMVNFQNQLNNTRLLRYRLEQMAARHQVIDVHFGYFDSNRIRFEKMGIKYREVLDEKELERKEATTTLIWPNIKVGVVLK